MAENGGNVKLGDRSDLCAYEWAKTLLTVPDNKLPPVVAIYTKAVENKVGRLTGMTQAFQMMGLKCTKKEYAVDQGTAEERHNKKQIMIATFNDMPAETKRSLLYNPVTASFVTTHLVGVKELLNEMKAWSRPQKAETPTQPEAPKFGGSYKYIEPPA